MVQLVEVFTRQILNDDPDITGIPDLVLAARVFTQELDRVKAKKYSNVWFSTNIHPPV